MALEQIGQKLKAAREAQGLSLPQVFERTKIPINHLQSIENGLTEDLPEPVYISGFLKRFGDCVGLNGQSLSDEFRSANGNAKPVVESGQSWTPRMMSQPQPVVSHGYTRSGLEVRAPNIVKQGLLYSLMIVMVLGIMSFLVTWQSNNQINQQDPTSQLLKNGRYTGVFNNNGGAQQTAPAVTQTAPPPAPVTDPTAVGDAQTLPATPETETGASVAVNASQHVWVDITSVGTGQSLYTGFMERGERKDFKDPQGLKVHAGIGSAVTVEADGKNDTLGPPGHMAEKVFMGKSTTATAVTAPGATVPLTPEAKAAAAAAALKAAAVKKAIKKTVTADAAPRRHSRPAEDVSAHSSAPAAAIDVPYRYTENHSDNE